MVAEMVGTERVWEQSFYTNRSLVVGRFDTGRGNRRQVERFIIDPNEIKTLPTGKAVVITKIPEARARVTRITPPRRSAGRDGPELG
jgi:hypothetical protein